MSATTTLSITSSTSFYERIVLKKLSQMKYGKLTLQLVDGQQIVLGDGTKGIQADIRICRTSFFKRCILYGDIGFGEAYMDGDWDTSSITNVIRWMLLNINNAPTLSGSEAKTAALNVLRFINRIAHLGNNNSLKGSRKNIREHYDLSNSFFAAWLDDSMTYSSAFFAEETYTLEQAQQAKYDRLSKLMKLQPDHHVLEIGTGWGANAIHMASHYGCKVTSITISKEQQQLAREHVKKVGLENRIDIQLKDYRHIKGCFDRIVSIEMLEAVGAAFFEPYFAQCNRLLKKDGLVALQVITCPDSRFEEMRRGVDWIQKHIFPGSLLPSLGALNTAINRTSNLTLVDVKDLGMDYSKTLHIWRNRFNAVCDQIQKMGFDERFMRKWNYYLSYCEAAFAMRNINVLQLLYTRPNNSTY
jgi:cyclopropane-fatty-acyl-phospholipid synthase